MTLFELFGLYYDNAQCALQAASWNGNLEMVKYLCKTVGLGAEDVRACYALQFACCYNQFEVVRYFCETLGMGVEDARDHTWGCDFYTPNIIEYLDLLPHLIQWKKRTHWIGVAVNNSPWCPGKKYTKWVTTVGSP